MSLLFCFFQAECVSHCGSKTQMHKSQYSYVYVKIDGPFLDLSMGPGNQSVNSFGQADLPTFIIWMSSIYF